MKALFEKDEFALNLLSRLYFGQISGNAVIISSLNCCRFTSFA